MVKKEKNINKGFILALVIPLLMVCAAPISVFAGTKLAIDDVTASSTSLAQRETKNFDVYVEVGENNSYKFTETIGTVFNTEGHGIYRYIPTSFHGISEKVNKGWCSTDPISTETDGNNYVLQIGSEDKMLKGNHTFKLGYTITMRDDRDTSRDLLYIDVLPTNWQTPIESTKITVALPKKIDKDKLNVYGGVYGEQGVNNNITWKYDGNKTITIEGKNLDKGVGVTIKADLPEGYWIGQNDAQAQKIGALIICILMAVAFVILWARFGRRQHIVTTVEFHPPEGVTPAEIGLIIDGSLDKKDMVSMYMYFAQKGYMKIKEKKKSFVFTKLKGLEASEKGFASVLFDGTFEKGSTVNTDDMDEDFGYSYSAACDVLKDEFGDVMPASSRIIQKIEGIAIYLFAIAIPVMAGAYMLRADGSIIGGLILSIAAAFITGRIRNSYKNRFAGKVTGTKAVRIILWIIDALLVILVTALVGSAFESAVLGLVFFIAFAVCQIMNVYFDKLTEKVCDQMGKVLGLRQFIMTAELDRINQLVEEDPEYFYSILPYAYVMGLTNKWAKKFEQINTDMPAWYETSREYDVVPAIFMGHALNNMSGHIATSVLPEGALSGSDNGGGFSGGGGGFSGGGAGGGGGGFW